MRHPEGGFFSSQDADSEGRRGKFFVWSWDELVSLVGEEAAEAFGATPAGNWDGTNVLLRPPGGYAAEQGLDPAALEPRRGRPAPVVRAREARVHPGVDDKILTAWNALAIRAFAEAGRIFDDRPTWKPPSAAQRSSGTLRDEHGRLLRSWREGVGPPGFADDHALLAGVSHALRDDRRRPMVRRGAGAVRHLLDRFADEERGGFFQTERTPTSS